MCRKSIQVILVFVAVNNMSRHHLHIFLIELKLSPDSAKKQLDAANEDTKTILRLTYETLGMKDKAAAVK